MKPGQRLLAWMLPHAFTNADGRTVYRLCNTNIVFDYDPDEGDGEFVDIDSFVALKQGQGDGTQALRLILGMCDIYGVKLNLFARAMDHKPRSTRRLIGWYERHGFTAPTEWRPDDGDPDEVDEGHHGLDLFRAPKVEAARTPPAHAQ